MINICYQAFIIKTLFLSLVYFHNDINKDDKIDFLILSICAGVISNFIKFDFNTVISCNASCFLYFKSVNSLEILVSPSSFNNSPSLYLNFSFNYSISFIFSCAYFFFSLPSSKSCGFSKNLYLSSKVVKFASISSMAQLFSSSSVFSFHFVAFFISFICCSLHNFKQFSYLI